MSEFLNPKTANYLKHTDTYAYELDAKNRRVGKKKNGVLQVRYVYMDDLRIAAELNPNLTIKRRFVYGSKANVPDYYIEGANKFRIISDQLGSPRVIFNIGTGAVIAKYNHDEFGVIKANTNTALKLPFGFAGGLMDWDTGLVKFGARSYDPSLGRWLSKDPIGFGGGTPNLYNYVLSDPVNLIDPSGLSDVNLFPPNERIFQSDFKIRKDPGVFSVGGHGDEFNMYDPSSKALSSQQVSQMIKSSPGYFGQAVQLNSCSTGGSGNGFAQELSNILGVPVVAPSDILFIRTDGRTRVNNGRPWNLFNPRSVPLR